VKDSPGAILIGPEGKVELKQGIIGAKRHIHMTPEDAQRMGVRDKQTVKLQAYTQRPLSQPGQFLANERVTVIGPKGEFQNVAVLGPERKEAQIEISLTDGRTLGVVPPVRSSGDVKDSPGAVLIGPEGKVELKQGIIGAKRHIHMTPEDASRMGVRDKQTVKLQVYTARPLIFEDVLVRVSPDYATFVHLDYDEANACGFSAGDLGRIVP
jgi:propanediol utilization protein